MTDAVAQDSINNAIEAVNVSVGHGKITVLESSSFFIPKNQITLIIGLSGAGKTTLLKTLYGQKTIQKGQLIFNKTTSEKKKTGFHLRFGVLFQHHTLLQSMNVFENLALPLRYHYRLQEKEIEKKVYKALSSVDLEDYAHHSTEQLSGGMAKRCAMARALITEPDYFFCDEPFSGQDPITAKKLATYISQNTSTEPMTTVMVAHELALALPICHHVIFIHEKKIIFQGTAEDLLANKDPFIVSFMEGSHL